MDALARSFGLERRLLERLSTRTEPFEHGVAYFDEEYRERYKSNFLLADRRLDGVSADALLDAAEGILGGAGYEHREVVVSDDRHGERFAPTFAEHEYTVARYVTMVHRRAPDREAGLTVEELSFAGVRSLILEMYRRESDLSDETVRLFTDQHGKYERVIGARFFAARVDGELAGDCELWVDGPDALVENVGTLDEHRGRGVCRAVVLRAVEAARGVGAPNVFIVADDGDWPKDLFARLGFDRIGRTWQFIRWPKGTDSGG